MSRLGVAQSCIHDPATMRSKRHDPEVIAAGFDEGRRLGQRGYLSMREERSAQVPIPAGRARIWAFKLPTGEASNPAQVAYWHGMRAGLLERYQQAGRRRWPD